MTEPAPLAPRQRHDGWTPARRRLFLLTLARTGRVACGCAATGMSRAGAYALRARRDAARFAAAWDKAAEAGRLAARLAHRPARAGLKRLAELDRALHAAMLAEVDTLPRQGVRFVHFRDPADPSWQSARPG